MIAAIKWSLLYDGLGDVAMILLLVSSIIAIAALLAVRSKIKNDIDKDAVIVSCVIIMLIFLTMIASWLWDSQQSYNKSKKKDNPSTLDCVSDYDNESGNICTTTLGSKEFVVILRDNHKSTKQSESPEPIKCYSKTRGTK